jgi:CheY-like chemotaxis protein
MDGVEVLRRVKERWKNLPVILCTAYHYNDFSWSSDAYDEVFRLTELKQTVRDILGKSNDTTQAGQVSSGAS